MRDILARMKADIEARGNAPGRKWDESKVNRDEGGRFASSGGRARRAVQITRDELEKMGGPKQKKPKPTRASSPARNVEAERQDAGKQGMEKLGFNADDFQYIDQQSASDPTDSTVKRLIEQGLMEEVNGKAYPTTLGRRIAKNVSGGNVDAAQEALDRYEEKKRQREEREAERETKRTNKEVNSYVPPQSVRSAAKRGLELRTKFGRGGTSVGIARARDLSNGKSIPIETINRMVSFFARHSVDKRPDWSNPSNPTNGYIAHLLWGGDAGRSWANGISKRNKS